MEIEFEPYKKVTFQSYLAYENAEAFAKIIVSAVPHEAHSQTKLFWANGVLFRPFSHPPSEALSSEILKGHIIYDHVEFAPMAEYKSELKIVERPLVLINILNVSNHVVFDPLSKWIHDKLIAKKSLK